MKNLFTLLVGALCCISATAQPPKVLLQTFYYDIPKAQCGAKWADTIRLQANSLATAGFTDIWTPPFQGNGANSGGYDPRDLYIGTNSTLTALGTKAEIKTMTDVLTAAGLRVTADMIYNHRDGGRPEINNPVLDYVMNKAGNTIASGYQYSMPSDRFRFILPLGGTSGNGVGKYYVNMSSRSGTYNGSQYRFFASTQKLGGSVWSAPSGGTVAEQGPAVAVNLNTTYTVNINSNGDSDEFEITVNAASMNATDTLIIEVPNINPSDITSYSNHRPWKIWYDPQGSAGNGSARDLADASTMFNGGSPLNPNYKLRLQTYTDFCSGMASGRGCLNGDAFRPNWTGNPAGDASQTTLGPAYSEQSMDYFYDYDHLNTKTRDSLIAWTMWSWDYLNMRSLRMDAIKHFPASFVGDMLCAMKNSGRSPALTVGEWYGQDAAGQGNWLTQVYTKLNACGAGNLAPKVFDFNLREELRSSSDGFSNCGNASAKDVRNVFQGGLTDGHSFNKDNVVTMLNNHDFRDPGFGGNSLVQDRADALNSYAYMFTNPRLGTPSVFWPDYYGYPANVLQWNGTACVASPINYFPSGFSQGLKTDIDKLIKVRSQYTDGASTTTYTNQSGGPAINYISGCFNRSLIYQTNATGSVGGKETVTAINYGDTPLDVEIPLTVRNGIALGQVFTNVATASGAPTSTLTPAVSTNANGQTVIRVTIPPHSFGTWVQGAPLPVRLVEFNATAKDDHVALDWNTSSEEAFAGFEVQRSTDARNFTNVGSVAAKGSKQTGATYTHQDFDLPNEEILYYRLKMKDTDGTSAFSNLRSVRIEANAFTMVLSPNPADGNATLSLRSPYDRNVSIRLIGTDGRIVKTIESQLSGGRNSSVEFSLDGLPAGLYQVQVLDGQRSWSQKLMHR